VTECCKYFPAGPRPSADFLWGFRSSKVALIAA